MVSIDLPFRRAVPDDANDLAEFVNLAGEGLPLFLWEQLAAAGASGWEVGRTRARRASGAFSFRNAILRLVRDEVVACLIGYPLEDDPPATDYSAIRPMFVPLQQLEDMVPGTWYINVVATKPAHRGKGYGKELLALAESIGASLGKRGLSLVVADTNLRARRLYAGLGYRELAQRPMIKERWTHPGTSWVLMVKDLAVGPSGASPGARRRPPSGTSSDS
jgi:ribosomal protein S18 acetylase RimI-like enzyme